MQRLILRSSDQNSIYIIQLLCMLVHLSHTKVVATRKLNRFAQERFTSAAASCLCSPSNLFSAISVDLPCLRACWSDQLEGAAALPWPTALSVYSPVRCLAAEPPDMLPCRYSSEPSNHRHPPQPGKTKREREREGWPPPRSTDQIVAFRNKLGNNPETP